MGNDGDFSWKHIDDTYDSKLRNQLGNMLNRVLVMLKKEGGALTVTTRPGDDKNIGKAWAAYDQAFEKFEVHTAIQSITTSVDCMNANFNTAEPWKLKGEERTAVLSTFAEALRHAALTLLPFVPDTAYRISKQLNVPYAEEMLQKDFVITKEMKTWGGIKGWETVGEPSILFVPLEK